MWEKVKRFYLAMMLAVLVPVMAHAEPAGLTLPSSVDLSDLYPYWQLS